ncbi:MAG: hypothetical protein BM556_04955 [Bacteriovorax sp. MedPE-SWde]|nr:MAG: hypothetical protein BM556_04955 [Bacteriovorax sp. MedPE-SWde]
MSKKIIFIFTVLISVAAFAASPLVQEYKRRKSTVFTDAHRDVFSFVKTLEKDPAQITELELFGKTGKFVLKFKSGEACFGDIPTALLECYNSLGYRTFYEGGDSD